MRETQNQSDPGLYRELIEGQRKQCSIVSKQIDHLPSMYKALLLIPNIESKQKEKREIGRRQKGKEAS